MRANILKRKLALRARRKRRVRGNIFGVVSKPRVSIFKSNRTIYAQAIDDKNSFTLCVSDGNVLGLKANKESATKLGADLADKLKAKNITEVVFDRNGYVYHGVIASFGDSLRKNGIKL